MPVLTNERVLERRLVTEVKALGWPIVKLNLQGNSGWPDRMILLPAGRVIFVELKRPGESPRSLQCHVHELLRQLGHHVEVIDDYGGLKLLLDGVRNIAVDSLEGKVNDDDR